MLKCVIFDVDGTLINTEKAILLSLQQTMVEKTGQNLSLEDLAFTFGIPGKVALQKLEVPDVDDAMARWVELSYDYAGEAMVFEGIVDTLKVLNEKGIKTGIVTSQARSDLEELLKYFNIREYFDILISASDTEKHKPDPEPILAFLQRAELQAGEAVYIGDTRYDQQSAFGADVSFGLALWGTKNPEMEASYKFNHPNEILTIL